MEKKRWLTGRKVAGVVFILFMIDVSCFGAWWAITHPPEKLDMPEGVRIGLPVDMTHYSGKHMRMGAELAADEINKYGTGGPLEPGEGGILVQEPKKERLPAVIVYEDSQEMSPDVGTERAVAAVTKLITTHKVNVIIAGYAEPMSMIETCVRYKTIFMCPGTSADQVTEPVIVNYEKYKYVFRTVPNSTMLGMWMVDFYTCLRDNYGFSKVAVIAEEYTWVDATLAYFEDHTPEGMTIVYKIRAPSTTTSWMPFLTEAQDRGAQVIMPIIALDWGVTFIKEWKAMRYGLSVGLLISSERSTYWEETDGACEYHVELQYGIPHPNVTAWTFPFYSSFLETYDEHPMYAAEYAYSATYAYARAVERAGTLDSDAVVAELEKTDMISPYNRLAFGSSHCGRFEEYWPEQFSQWLGPEYRPTVWSNVESFTTDDYTCDSMKVADLTLPTEDEDYGDEWEIPGDWHYPP